MKTLDCRGQQCPQPVVEARRLILAEPGLPLTVLVGDEIARENVSRMAASLGYDATVDTAEDGYVLTLTPGGKADGETAPDTVRGRTAVFFTSDTLGKGDDELGRILLKNFLFTLAETAVTPDILLFANAGVKLTSEGSEVLEPLEKLVDLGVDIASCGLCLDFFHLKDSLAVGRTTNMLEIVETLQGAGRIIRP